MAGHIKIDRKILNWEWYGESNMVHVFLHLLIKANYADSRFKGILVKRGQVIVGRTKLAATLGLSEMQIRNCLNKLKSTNEITIKSTNKYSIVTICKYDDYQSDKRKDNQQETHQINQQVSNKQPTDNQQTTTSKEEYKNNKEDNTASQIEFKSDVEKPFDWGVEVTKFLQDSRWREEFCMSKGLKDKELFKVMKEFTTKLTLQEDFKDSRGLKKHFVNHYNKYGLVVSQLESKSESAKPQIVLK